MIVAQKSEENEKKKFSKNAFAECDDLYGQF
jgi:hypothetical protein